MSPAFYFEIDPHHWPTLSEQKGIRVSASAPSGGRLDGQEVGLGGAGKTDGAGGVSALPRAQGWCGRARGSSGTWLALEFYCAPARAWHSHENGYGRTEGRKERMKESGGQWRDGREAAEEGSRCGGVGKRGGGSAFYCCGFGLFADGAILKAG